MSVDSFQKKENDKASRAAAAAMSQAQACAEGTCGAAAGMPLFLDAGPAATARLRRDCPACVGRQEPAVPLAASLREQTKLVAGAVDDPLEREADRVAAAVMTGTDQAHAPGYRWRPAIEAAGAATRADAGAALGGALGRGAPMEPGLRAWFEARFARDFGQVRLHTNPDAARAAREANAQAFALGPHIAFASGFYLPNSHEGRRLIAHELAHVVQTGGKQGHTVLRHPDRPPRSFALGSSEVGQRIRAGLEAESASSPGPTPDAPRVRLVDPDDVLAILESSPLFLDEAWQVERLYFIDRTRTPEITFVYHLQPALGSEFERARSLVVVEVSSLREVVRSTVHEIVHARHRAPAAAAATRRHGEVTRAEEAGVHEEAQTRMQERRIMAEIAAREPWRSLIGEAATERPPRRAEDLHQEVRESFVSGWPMLTYQEFFIIGAMKAAARPRGIETSFPDFENRTLAVARLLWEPIMRAASPENAGRFLLTENDVARHQRVGAQPEPVPPPTVSEAMECARRYRANRDWQRAFRARNRLPEAIDMSRSCRAFIEGYQSTLWEGEIPYVPEWAYAVAERYEPYDRDERFYFFAALQRRMFNAYQTIVAGREEGREISGWYGSVPAAQRSGALAYLEWLLIQETMAREWRNIGPPAPNEPESTRMRRMEARRRHLDCLEARIGRPLRGISRSGLPPAP